uniref:Uncharacterized protein n=1 Tax=Aegilops tauschii subsp. strangulata TaxID=200361 RepID=A0A453GNB4_AEGTS
GKIYPSISPARRHRYKPPPTPAFFRQIQSTLLSHDCGDQGRQYGGGRPLAELGSTTRPSPREHSALSPLIAATSDGGLEEATRPAELCINQRQRIGGGRPTRLSFPTDCSDRRRLTVIFSSRPPHPASSRQKGSSLKGFGGEKHTRS